MYKIHGRVQGSPYATYDWTEQDTKELYDLLTQSPMDKRYGTDAIQNQLTRVGSQQLGYVNAIANRLNDYADKQWAEQTAKLKEAGVNVDEYRFPEEAIADFGSGSSANKGKQISQAWMRIQSMQKAAPVIQKATQQYEETGDILPPPTREEQAQKYFKGGNQALMKSKASPKWQAYLSGQPAQTINAIPTTDVRKNGYNPSWVTGGTIEEATQTVNKQAAVQQPQQQYYKAGDANPFTGRPMSQLAADNYNKQLAAGRTVAGKTGEQIATATPTAAPSTLNQQANAPSAIAPTVSGVSTDTSSTQGGVVDESYLDVINKSNLDEGTKALLRAVVRPWDPMKEINIQNIKAAFENIKKTTISPYFQEQANIFIDEVKRAGAFAEGERQRELEVQDIQSQESIRNKQAELESRGLTFSGEAERQLGEKAAFGAQKEGAMPARFGGQEGLVNTGNRLTASSSAARYQKNLADLSRQAEVQLGTEKAKGLVPGYGQLGNVTGQLPRQEKQAQGSALTDIYQQELQNVAARQPLKVL